MIDQLEALAALAEHGTMRRAATRLRISQSAVTKRLDAYHAMTAPLVPFYEARGLLRRVDGVGTPRDITIRIERALG